VLLVDADPSGSALEWSDFAAMDPVLPPQAAFPFRIVALPSRDLHRRIPEIARPDDVVIIDAPQLEDHAGIARSALRYVDEILIPCAPSPIEINRTTPVRDEITEVAELRDRPSRSAVLLNRCVARANSTPTPGRRWRASVMACWERLCRGWRSTLRASAFRFPPAAWAFGAAWRATSPDDAFPSGRRRHDSAAGAAQSVARRGGPRRARCATVRLNPPSVPGSITSASVGQWFRSPLMIRVLTWTAAPAGLFACRWRAAVSAAGVMPATHAGSCGLAAWATAPCRGRSPGLRQGSCCGLPPGGTSPAPRASDGLACVQTCG
jgi:hypothetical protein